MAIKEKNFWILLILLLSGIVVGGLLGELAKQVNYLWWLGYGQEFGIYEPLALDLGILKLTFGLVMRINIASILGMVVAIIVYRKV
jgi:hypothetical protein